MLIGVVHPVWPYRQRVSRQRRRRGNCYHQQMGHLLLNQQRAQQTPSVIPQMQIDDNPSAEPYRRQQALSPDFGQ
jgi:hypothetical protein